MESEASSSFDPFVSSPSRLVSVLYVRVDMRTQGHEIILWITILREGGKLVSYKVDYEKELSCARLFLGNLSRRQGALVIIWTVMDQERILRAETDSEGLFSECYFFSIWLPPVYFARMPAVDNALEKEV